MPRPVPAVVDELLRRADTGERPAIGELLSLFQEPLLRLVELRMDPRLRARIDAQDVLQETFVEASQRFASWLSTRSMPFHLWLRFLALQRLAKLSQSHLSVEGRAVGAEAAALRSSEDDVSSGSLCAELIASITSPTRAARDAEVRERVTRAVEMLSAQDREIVLLRQYEGLSNEDAALVLGVEPSAASKRFLRAVERLGKHLREAGIESVDDPR